LTSKAAHSGSGHAVIGTAPRAATIPCPWRACPRNPPATRHTAVQQIGIFQHLVVEVILGRNFQRTRLDAHVDVFRHQDDLPVRLLLLEERHHAENLVVDLAERQDRGDIAGDRMRLQEQPAGGGLVAVFGKRSAILDVHFRSN
jgi:hypothetical protein